MGFEVTKLVRVELWIVVKVYYEEMRKKVALAKWSILWAVSTNVGEVGQKIAEAKVRRRQEWRQVSNPGWWSCQHQRASGKVSVESIAEMPSGSRGSLLAGGTGKEANWGKGYVPFCVPGSPLLILWSSAQTSYSQGSPQTRVKFPLTHSPITLQFS